MAANNSNGQISYLILDSLSHGSKYGLEIIEYISNKTNGTSILKKPTLYSCLTRMEKKGWISSSYWGESEFGGKRHYYSITENGKRNLQLLSAEFENSSYSASQSLSQETVPDLPKYEEHSEETATSQENKPVFLQQDNIFNLMKQNQNNVESKNQTGNQEGNANLAENQIDIFSFAQKAEHFENTEQVSNEAAHDDFTQNKNVQNEITLESTDEEVLKATSADTSLDNNDFSKTTAASSSTTLQQSESDARFLDDSERLSLFQQQQNRRLYDTSSDLKKYRKRKSFSENQIEMSVVYETSEDQELQRSRIEALKASMLNTRQNQTRDANSSYNQFNRQPTSYLNEEIEAHEETVDSDKTFADDAVFITTPHLSTNEIPVQRKITPPTIDVDVTDSNLPAPKRDSNLEPTYKDMMAKLFERKKEKQNNTDSDPQPQPKTSATVQDDFNATEIDSFTDFGTLRKYYNSHGIEFKEYQKVNVQRRHNTNFLNFINSALLLLLSGMGCAILYGILYATGKLVAGTNFMFYTIPLLFAVYSVFAFIRYKVYPSKKAVMHYNVFVVWAIFLLACVIVLVANVIAGMQVETIQNYITSIVVPVYGLILAFPLNFHLTKLLFKKFAK